MKCYALEKEGLIMLVKATAMVKFRGMNVMFLIYSFTMQQKPL